VLSSRKKERKYQRVFFATDLHASDIVFRKFLGAAKFYDLDALIMGGDVFGKALVPIVQDSGGLYGFEFNGQDFEGIPEKEIEDHEMQIANAGDYSRRFSEGEYDELASDPKKVEGLFEELMVERMNHWARLAWENLQGTGVRCYWTGGNDDKQELLDRVATNDHFPSVEGKVVRLEGRQELASLGWSNPTPWHTPRECSEEELTLRLEKIENTVRDPRTCVLNIHPPPFDSTLDMAPKLDQSVSPPRPITSGGHQVLIPVGSTSVRKTIERLQPALLLCVDPSTIILGENKPISDVRKGELAVGMTTTNVVRETFARPYSGEMTRIKGSGLLPFSVTSEHPILAVRKKRTIKRIRGTRRNVNVFSAPRWTPPHDIKPVTTKEINGDYLVLPRISGTENSKWIPLDQFIKAQGSKILRFPLNEETAWLLGLYAAEGHNVADGVVFSSNTIETEIRKRIQGVTRDLGLSSITIPHRLESEISTMIASRALSRAFPAWCGHLAHNKRIPDFLLFHKDISLLRAFLRGHQDGDGGRENTGSGVIKLTTVSKTLALQLQLAYARLGITTSIYVTKAHEDVIQGRRVWSKEKYRIGFSISPRWTKSYVQKDRILVPVRRISRHNYIGTVHNLSTSDNTYLVSNVVTHNCGHIHETRNATKIGRTTCINPGSEYGSGYLRGVIINLKQGEVMSYQFTSG
jgi:Icc-related predicted phosphoesterase/signal peptidase I